MYEEKKNIFIVSLIAVILIIIAIFVRSADNVKQDESNIDPISSSINNENYVPEQAFFDNTIIDDVLPKTKAQIQKTNTNLEKATGIGSITARAYLIGNVATGKIIYEKNSAIDMPVASMSKLITAIVATDSMSSTTKISIFDPITVPIDQSGINSGESFTLNELLYPLLLDSSNISAEAIASSSGRANFIEQMSGYAWEVGMPKAYFADPSGISPHNIASAQGIFSLAQYLYKFRRDILELTRITNYEVATTSDHGSHIFRSIHPFVYDERFLGGKTGRTPEAGETMLTILEISKQPIAFIIMGSYYGNRENDTRIIINALKSGTIKF
ncbi:MAG: hypothetical protein WCW03_02705 [Candidatus Paceibacterota bacterium]|jgi:D-alanyl-D-alanine endopeptidase (penicillin-binding protein 7)